MRFPVFSANVNPSIDLPLLRKKRGYVQDLLNTGTARALDVNDFRKGVQLLALPKPDSLVEYLCIGNLIPFARVQNPMCKPDTINYPIPAVGARNRPQWCHPSILYMEAKAENRARLVV
jgi:hypothetical protein